MAIGLKREDEVNYLNKTINVIDDMLEEFGISSNKQSNDIKDDRKHFWTNFSELDEIEIQSFNQSMAMQEKIYLKNKDKIITLSAQKSAPYFARLDFKENGDSFAESLYIGISSITSKDFDFLVLDWRSPISNMFYDFEVGTAHYETPNGIIEGEIILNRQYNIKNGELKFIHESGESLQDESLLEVLASNTSDKMKNIVSSIQKKQNSIIRNDDSKILLLQGCAGSGKTSIAMHRAAYLLYKNRKTLKANNILILSPNDVFSDYISDVLPGLGEQNIREITFERFYKTHLPSIYRYEKKHEYLENLYSGEISLLREDTIKFKNTKEFTNLLDDFCNKLASILPEFSDIIFDDKIIIRKNKVKETFIERFKNIPYLLRVENLKESLYSQVETKFLKQKGNKHASDFGYNPIDHGSDIIEYFKAEVSRQVSAMFSTVNPVEIYKKLWLDSNKALKNNYKDVTLQSLNSGFINFEDIVPILYIRCFMEGFKDFNNTKHIIIDECQDYSPLFYSIIKKTFSNASATILGDLNQKIASDTNISNKEEIANIFGTDDTQIVSLTKSYRSTKNITDFAKNILKYSEEVEAVDRNGLNVNLIKSNNIEKDILNLIKDIQNRDLTSVAIITKTAKVARALYERLENKIDKLNLIIDDNSSYSKGISVIPSYISKGLEFDAVLIPDCDSSYSLESERNLLYTVCTRALHELHLMTSKEFSTLIK